MFNRSEIMKAAHRYAQAYKGRDWSYPFLLAAGLKAAWAEAKSGTTPAQRRAEAIRAEIDGLKFKSFNVNIGPRRRALEAALSSIAA
ncbi:hypothetical protein [Mesorhizobium sp. M0778]|uniref:hypothetical protein n=1 Tax=Mesorhizobium sp. M0778 TaxID=2956999 RepID=UPI003336198E